MITGPPLLPPLILAVINIASILAKYSVPNAAIVPLVGVILAEALLDIVAFSTVIKLVKAGIFG